jgi:uncharacterized protein YcgI (DUF1989 family)
MIKYGKSRTILKLQPVSGKALPVYSGEVLRIRQTLGEQCVDFNAFSLHDYKEHMEVSACRREIGFRPKKGDIIFSNPPRFRPMIGILEMSPTCVTDILGRSCHGVLFEASHGFDSHASCQDTIAEAIAEYRLTPDDVHHSLNFWMNTEWDSAGHYEVVRNTGKPDDYVDLVACFDQLMVPIVCGSGDVYTTSNYSYKPIIIEVFEASPETMTLVGKIIARSGSWRNQRSVDQFRVKEIRADRALQPVAGFTPNFINFPIDVQDIPVLLRGDELLAAQKLVEQGFGFDLGDVVRKAFMMWYNKNRARPRDWARMPAAWL